MRLLSLLGTSLLAGLGCAGGASSDDRAGTDDTTASDDSGSSCGYPEGAAEPMALDAVISPYRWADARHLDGRTGAIDLNEVFCASDEEIDWSPFDILLFVSIPAW